MRAIPEYEPDIYSDAAIADPYPHYAAMRGLGPVVHLPAHGIYALTRYADVKKALLGHTRFLSGEGVAGFAWPEAFRATGTLISDEPVHTRFRSVIGAPLQPPQLARLTAEIETAADDLIARLVAQGSFDGIADLAQFLPVSIVSTLVGLPERGRQRMLDWAAASFDLLGVENRRAGEAAPRMGEMFGYVQTECAADTVAPGGWAAQIWAAVADGRISHGEAWALHIDILAPSLDTTIFATGHLLHHLAANSEQWARLKADPALIPAAIDETVRLDSPIRAFARVAAGEQGIDGVTLPDRARVLMVYASANRDERRWDEPDRYWIERPGLNGHLGFGQGRHICVGMHLAKLEIQSLLKSILRRVDRIEVDAPTIRFNNVLHGFATLPTRFAAAA